MQYSKIGWSGSGSGQNPNLPHCNSNGRFTPKSSRNSDKAALTLCARTGLMHRSKKHLYSITSSARASRDAGISIPSVLTVLRLITTR